MGNDKDTGPAGAHPSCTLVLASENPQHLASFYGHLFNCTLPSPVTGSRSATLSLPMGMALVLYRPSHQRPQPRQHGRLALCLKCTNLEITCQRAMALGAHILEPMVQEPFGREQWLLDPEGNRLLLWQT